MGYANVSRPMGFNPLLPAGKAAAIARPRPVPAVRQASGGGNASTDLAVGDAYGIDANGNAFRAGPNDSVRGIVIGLRFSGNANVMFGQGPISYDYITGLMGGVGTAIVAYILGIEDPTVAFSVSSDTFAQTNVGGKFNLTDAAPDPTYSQSRQKLNVAGGAGAQFEAQDIVPSPADNAYGANAQVVVRMLQTFNN
jgi:hypothetical protein